MFLTSPALAENSDDLIKAVKNAAFSIDARVGFAAYDTSTGRRWEYHADQRFPMTSTFKTLACAALLHRVDEGKENLERTLTFSKSDLVTYSPVTETYAGIRSMSLAELCQAALTMSDNTAANIILKAMGGPVAVTSFTRLLGDDVTRLDRWETALNEAIPGDKRDTTTPNAMVQNLNALLFGNLLSEGSKHQLKAWLEGNQVAGALFRSVMPEGWVIADRTGAGGFGARSITAIIWPPEQEPMLVALYFADTEATLDDRNHAIAMIGKAVVLALKPAL